MNDTWYCAVSVATVWTSPQSVRDIDTAGLSNPVQLNKWLELNDSTTRLDLCDSDRVQTQILYGEPVIVEEIKGSWAKVFAVWQPSKKDARGYPGWVPLIQLKRAEPIQAEGFVKVTAHKAQLWTRNGSPFLVIPFNTILPYTGELEECLVVSTPDGEALILKQDVVRSSSIHQFDKLPTSVAVEKGLHFLNLPYLWGGTSSYGYDCSGFTYNMMKACGHMIPRDANDQALAGKSVDVFDQRVWEKGDLLFFAHDEGRGKIHHVGFYFGTGILLHAPSTGRAIELVKMEGTPFEQEVCAVRRYGSSEVESSSIMK